MGGIRTSEETLNANREGEDGQCYREIAVTARDRVIGKSKSRLYVGSVAFAKGQRPRAKGKKLETSSQ